MFTMMMALLRERALCRAQKRRTKEGAMTLPQLVDISSTNSCDLFFFCEHLVVVMGWIDTKDYTVSRFWYKFATLTLLKIEML